MNNSTKVLPRLSQTGAHTEPPQTVRAIKQYSALKLHNLTSHETHLILLSAWRMIQVEYLLLVIFIVLHTKYG